MLIVASNFKIFIITSLTHDSSGQNANCMIGDYTLNKRCNIGMLSKHIEYQRWKMFGHVLSPQEPG